MIGRDLVAKERENPRLDNVADWLRLLRQPREIRWIAHIGRLRVPAVGFALRRLELLPVGVAGENFAVGVAKHRARHILGDDLLDLLIARPNLAKINGLALLVA